MTAMEAMLRDERGTTFLEYGLIVALIAIFALIGVEALGLAVRALLQSEAGGI